MVRMFQIGRRSRRRMAGVAASLGALGVIAAVSPAMAHHSFAMFDRTKQVTLKGVVKQFQWTNPHIFVELAVMGDKGDMQNWSVEGASPNMLFRQGWTVNTFKPGDQVTVIINPLRDGAKGGTLVSAVLPGGKEIGGARGPG